MSCHSKTLGQIITRTVYAVTGRSVHGDTAAVVFEALMRYHGLTLVSTCGLVVRGDVESGPLDVVTMREDGIHLPEHLEEPYTPELAMRLGAALIAAATQSLEPTEEKP